MRKGILQVFPVLIVAGVVGISPKLSGQTSTPISDASSVSAPSGPSGPAAGEGGPPRRIGGGVSAPVVIQRVPAEYSEEARKARLSGTVLVNLIVDVHGMPQNVHVTRGIGTGLDEKAVEAIRQYRFKPAMEGGKPVPVQVNVEVNFQVLERKSAGQATDTQSASQVTEHKPSSPWESDPKYIAAIVQGKKLTEARQFNFAADAYRKANKIAGGKCTECIRQAIAAEMKWGAYKDAVKDADELIAHVENPTDKSTAEGLRGAALYAQGGDKPKPAQLEAAQQALQAAIADDPKNVPARYLCGTVLARMGQTEEARTQVESCLRSASPSDPAYLRAKRFAENPAMSYAKMAPSFTVTALDGSKFTLDEMGGRVVLIDFWATWCGPCNEELPQMKKIAKDFAGQPLVIISISWDDNEAKWKSFIAKNEMGWAQYRDADQSLGKLFGIDAIPHYFTIDSDGVLTAELMGSGYDVEGRLEKLVAKAKGAQPARGN